MVVLKHPRSVQKKLSGSSLAKLELERIRPREQVLGRPRPTIRGCPTTEGQRVQMQWEQTGFGLTLAVARHLSDATHCPIVTSEPGCPTTAPDDRSGPL